MSTAIIKYKGAEDPKFYCKTESYPAGLGFQLLGLTELKKPEYLPWIMCQGNRIEQVYEIPHDIEYEYTIDLKNNLIECQECWWSSDSGYNNGIFRKGRTFDLKQLRKSLNLQKQYSYRLPQYWK